MHKAKTFHINGIDMLATPVLAHAVGKGDMIAFTSEFGNGDFARTVVGHPVRERSGDKLRLDLGDGLALGSGHLFGLNDTLYRVLGARSGPVGSR